MANKTRIWTESELKEFNLVDCTTRALPLKEVVSVKCAKCDTVGSIKFSVLRSKMITYGLTWRCKSCQNQENSERGKLATGEKNGFYGKKHSKETSDQMRISSRKRWDNTPIEERMSIGARIRAEANEAFNGNPMLDPSVKQKYLSSMAELFSDPVRESARQAKREATCLKRYGAKTYFGSEEYLNNFLKYNPSNSSGEQSMREFIQSLGLSTRKIRENSMEIDIYIDDLRVGFEHNGLFHHCEARKEKMYHHQKFAYYDRNEIKLIQIFDNEWISKRKQVESRIRSILGKNENKIGARLCEVRGIPMDVAKNFMNEYHIQGYSLNTTLSLGLFYQDQLLCVGCFGSHHRDSKKQVMNRFCGKENWSVAGGLSKITKTASSLIKKSILTWCDLRWSNGKGYEQAGWMIEEILPPDYFYIKNGRTVIKKQARRRSVVNTPEGMTEHEHALLDGLFRVYDCGKIRYIYKYKES